MWCYARDVCVLCWGRTCVVMLGTGACYAGDGCVFLCLGAGVWYYGVKLGTGVCCYAKGQMCVVMLGTSVCCYAGDGCVCYARGGCVVLC